MNVDYFPALRCVVSYNSGILHSQRILGDRRVVPSSSPLRSFVLRSQNRTFFLRPCIHGRFRRLRIVERASDKVSIHW